MGPSPSLQLGYIEKLLLGSYPPLSNGININKLGWSLVIDRKMYAHGKTWEVASRISNAECHKLQYVPIDTFKNANSQQKVNFDSFSLCMHSFLDDGVKRCLDTGQWKHVVFEKFIREWKSSVRGFWWAQLMSRRVLIGSYSWGLNDLIQRLTDIVEYYFSCWLSLFSSMMVE